jgi:hypothetical protein
MKDGSEYFNGKNVVLIYRIGEFIAPNGHFSPVRVFVIGM